MTDETRSPAEGNTAETADPAAVRLRRQDEARCRQVENAIYKRARGYKVAVKKTYKVKRVEYDPDTGKKVSEREELETGVDEVVVPADVRAGAYWLVNRDPVRWQEHPQSEPSETVGGGVEFPPLVAPDEDPSAASDDVPEGM